MMMKKRVSCVYYVFKCNAMIFTDMISVVAFYDD